MEGKTDALTCEDGIVVTDNFVAVIDGSTSKAKQQIEQGVRNGRFAMLLLKEVVENLPYDASLEHFCREATCKFQAIYSKHGISHERLLSNPEERLTASIALFSFHYREIWMVGDCQCLVENKFYDNPKPEEERLAKKRSAVINEMIASGKTDIPSLRKHDAGRDVIVSEIAGTCRWQNITFSVVDGFDIAMDKVKRISVDHPCDVVMSTDGYPFLHPTLAKSEKALADLLSNDPLCIRDYMATKGKMYGQSSFDDRAYIRFHVS